MTASVTEPAGPGAYRTVAAIGIGGALGANARYLVGREITDHWPAAFPWGTLIVNVSGCLAVGILIGWLLAQGDRPLLRLSLATGFLGAYTTFSTFAYEAVRLFEDGKQILAITYIAASLVLCLASSAGGLQLTRRA